eukprot:TRINITY_DN1522_c0_g1_i2.p1 TRINITY_DN1522_c0_g1~~TRINITY_DN1522_c0_g1_i2.p1  ORF type:complete len:126 (+),score=22.80 TRINITY_DN1522_c0_g1_i2:108-485(+)
MCIRDRMRVKRTKQEKLAERRDKQLWQEMVECDPMVAMMDDFNSKTKHTHTAVGADPSLYDADTPLAMPTTQQMTRPAGMPRLNLFGNTGGPAPSSGPIRSIPRLTDLETGLSQNFAHVPPSSRR